MANSFWCATGLTGGGSSLDGIDGNKLTVGDAAVVVLDDTIAKVYFYRLYGTGDSESSPNVIVPDANPGTKCWKLATPISP